MTEKEMSEIFSVMLLAYPNAECFKGGKEKLLPTIKLWHRCCLDVDFWTAQRAVYKLITECKYPPTIAEFLEKAKATTDEVNEFANMVYHRIRSTVDIFGIEKAGEHLVDFDRDIVRRIGGIDKILSDDRKMFRYDAIIAACIQTARSEPAMPGGKPQKQIGDGK